ncbi:MAG TPA: protease pro-enzyme activation domain-containing protein, partial [Ktedonobacteraceae bacterium]|nr:protease pro-enzyme activation domain-containing protein [Ktedonobacteraceae bacterium]
MGLERFRLNKNHYHIPKSPIMLVPLLCIFLLGSLFYFFPFHFVTGARATGLAPLPGHVPALVRKSHLLGATNPAAPLTLLVGLRLRNQASLQAYVSTLSRPHAVTAHHYLTPMQVAAAYGPLDDSQNAVIAFMQQAGFSETMTFKQHLLIGFQGTTGQAEAAFHVQISNYRAPDGRQFYAPASNPLVPAELATIIQSVSGLDNAAHFTHPPITPHKKAHNTRTGASVLCPTPDPGGAYFIPTQIASAYNLNGLYNVGFRG